VALEEVAGSSPVGHPLMNSDEFMAQSTPRQDAYKNV
jgi:hypothetical protein